MTQAELRNLTLIQPSPLSSSWPFTVSHSITGHNGQITLTLDVPALWARNILAVLRLLTDLVTDLRTEADRADRACRVNAEHLAWAARREEIKAVYCKHREQGLLHRAAVRELVRDPRFRDLSWGFPDFNRVVPGASHWKEVLA